MKVIERESKSSASVCLSSATAHDKPRSDLAEQTIRNALENILRDKTTTKTENYRSFQYFQLTRALMFINSCFTPKTSSSLHSINLFKLRLKYRQ